MDYLGALNDPLKGYFKEKMGNLYLNKDVIRFLVETGEKGEGQQFRDFSESYLQATEVPKLEKPRKKSISDRIVEKPSQRRITRSKRRNSLELYDKALKKKKLENDYKHRNEPQHHTDTGFNKLDKELEQFKENNSIVKTNLDLQSNTLECKIYVRKQKTMMRGKVRRFD